MSQPTASLTCPKCHAAMRTYERSGVHVDQCTQCRGIFLDRGELERLVDAESSFYERTPAPAGTRYDQPRYEQPRYDQPRYEERHYEQQYDDRGYRQYPHKRKKSFFSELFDD